MFKKQQAINYKNLTPIKYVFITLLVIMTPLTLFLMSFSWYDSIEVHNTHGLKILSQPGIFTSALDCGAIGLVSALAVLFVYLIIDFALDNLLSLGHNMIFFIGLFIYSIIFINFEVLSVVFLWFYFSIQLLVVIFFLPIVYGLLIVIALLNRYIGAKNKDSIAVRQIIVDAETIINNDSEIIIM